MPVQGPYYSDEQVEKVYNAVMETLKQHGIQKFPPTEDYRTHRLDRNRYLKFAIEMLVELESWESW